jgi:hypothetical protein
MNYYELRQKFAEEKGYPSWDCNNTVKQEYVEWLENRLETILETSSFKTNQLEELDIENAWKEWFKKYGGGYASRHQAFTAGVRFAQKKILTLIKPK